MKTPHFNRDKKKIDSPSWLQLIGGKSMQILVQRHNHSNRWPVVTQWKIAPIALKACRFLDLLNLKKSFF